MIPKVGAGFRKKIMLRQKAFSKRRKAAIVASGARFGDEARIRVAIQSRAAGDRLLSALRNAGN